MKKNTLNTGVIRLIATMFIMSFSLNIDAAVTTFSFDKYLQENGLPNNQIQCIFQDSKGWMWIGTSQGLSRFDGYEFRNFLPNMQDSLSLKGNIVRVIKEDKQGNLLIGTENGGLNIFNRTTEKFTHPLEKYPSSHYVDISVNDIERDGHGVLWLGTDINIFTLDSTGNIRPIKPKTSVDVSIFEGNFVRILQFDNRGKLWVGTNDGMFIYDPANNEMSRFDLPFTENQNHEIWEIYLDDEGLLWVGTYSAGLFLVDPEARDIRKIKLEPEIDRTETVRSISKGVFGEYWIGTRGGLYTYSKVKGVTGFFKHDERDARSLSNNSILSLFHDSKGETWIGTRGGLNLLAKSKQVFHSFGSLSGDNHFLNSSIVYAFWIDHMNRIWLGTEDGGINIYDTETGRYSYIMAGSNSKTSISQNCIKAFLDDGRNHLWVATFLGGIDVIDLNNNEVTNYKANTDVQGSFSDNRVWDLCADKNKNIWIASDGGVDQYIRKTNSFRHFPQLNGNNKVSWIECDSKGNLWMGSDDELIIYNPEENSVKRFNEYTRSMFEDSKNRTWVATTNRGIAVYSIENGPLKYYSEQDGLANNHALCILEDSDNNLWISTNNGLSRFSPEKELFYNFTSKDGLSNNQFCYGAAYKTKTGDLMFGTVSGFNKFNPSEIIPDDNNIPIVFTDLKIFNKSVPISNKKHSVLKTSISETKKLVLNFDQNVFTLEFAALNYTNSENNLYSYKLEGFNRDWNEPSKIRSATYTNLNPGDYTLRIKRVIPGMPDDGNELQLAISVLPPFWKTKWFILLMVGLIALLFYVLMQFAINREKIKNQLMIERVNARKLHELDMLKLKFFTNISHEIRTPLTLILGPLEKMLAKRNADPEIEDDLKLMHRNANNLNKLVNQLLDFRKLQTGNLKLNLTEADIVGFIRNIVNSFNDFAIEKQVKLKFNTLKQRLFVSFDPDKIEKIMNNLLSNAFKFTDSGGSISVNISLIFDTDDDDFSASDKEKQYVEIAVKDTGSGISESNLNRVFMRFFQSDDKNANAGVGIGLALVKELVSLHKGKIFVTSKPGKGTKFTIRIPYTSSTVESISENVTIHEEKANEIAILEKMSNESPDTMHSRIMLVIDDNPDVRQFITSHFNDTFKTIEAKNGEEGWEVAVKIVPDIIISDIIMPNVDGYELCKRIKSDVRTSHIPVLLLTALHSKDHELKGLTIGADDYITKPFDLTVLQAKVENMLSIRESLKEKYASTVVLEPTNVVLPSPDERFLQKAIEVVEINISDSELDIESFAVQVGVSRMQLYRKLHALTDMTVKEFIRHIRLKRATQLLVQQKLNVSEVAYEVGFKDLSHFRKCFKREFGVSATEYVAQSQKQ